MKQAATAVIPLISVWLCFMWSCDRYQYEQRKLLKQWYCWGDMLNVPLHMALGFPAVILPMTWGW